MVDAEVEFFMEESILNRFIVHHKGVHFDHCSIQMHFYFKLEIQIKRLQLNAIIQFFFYYSLKTIIKIKESLTKNISFCWAFELRLLVNYKYINDQFKAS